MLTGNMEERPPSARAGVSSEYFASIQTGQMSESQNQWIENPGWLKEAAKDPCDFVKNLNSDSTPGKSFQRKGSRIFDYDNDSTPGKTQKRKRTYVLDSDSESRSVKAQKMERSSVTDNDGEANYECADNTCLRQGLSNSRGTGKDQTVSCHSGIIGAVSTQVAPCYQGVKFISSAGQVCKTSLSSSQSIIDTRSKSKLCTDSQTDRGRSIHFHGTDIGSSNHSNVETLPNTYSYSKESSSSDSKRTSNVDSLMGHTLVNDSVQVPTTDFGTTRANSVDVAEFSQTGFTGRGSPSDTSLRCLDTYVIDDYSTTEEENEDQSPLRNPLQEHMKACSCCQKCNGGLPQPIHTNQRLLKNAALKPYTYQLCNAKFMTLDCYKEHMLFHRRQEIHACQYCGAKFGICHYLQEHMAKHTHPHTCKRCGTRFALRSFLKQHMVIHTGQTPYTCQYCDAKFAWRQYLKLHMYLHTGQKPFACRQCDARFLQHSNLEEHMIRHTTTSDIGS